MKRLLAVLVLLAITGCASDNALLAVNYAKLSDKKLLAYYNQLDSQVKYLENSFTPSGPANDSGMTGRGTANINVLTLGATSDLNALRLRRMDVRMELSNRGVEVD